MQYSSFGSLFEDAPVTTPVPSITDAKAALLRESTEAKIARLDPFHQQTKELEVSVAEGHKALADRLIKHQADSIAQQTQAARTTKDISDTYNPNSQFNRGKRFTAGEIEDDGLLSVAGGYNLTMGAKKGAGDVAGRIATAPANASYAHDINAIDGDALTAHAKQKEHNALQDQMYKDAADMQKQVDAGLMAPEVMQNRIEGYNHRIEQTRLSEQETALLDTTIDAPRLEGDYAPDESTDWMALKGVTNKQAIDDAQALRAWAKQVPKTIDEAIGGSAHYQGALGSKFSEVISKKNEADTAILNKAAEAMKKGDYGQAAMEGLPALARVIYTTLYEGAKNPHASAQLISEEFADLALARLGPLGMTASLAESFGLATEMQADGIEKFMAENGRKPTPDEFAEITAWSYAGGALDMAADVFVSGAGKGMLKGMSKATQNTTQMQADALKAQVRNIQKTATNQSAAQAAETVAKITAEETAESLAALSAQTSKGLIRRAAESVAKGGVSMHNSAITEGLTEGGQQVIDDYLSELKPVGDLKDAVHATALGALIGGGMGPASKAIEIPATIALATAKGTAKAVSAGIQSAKDASAPKSAEGILREKLHQGNAAHGYEDSLKAAVDAKDVEAFSDPAKPEFNPHLAIDALVRMNADPDLPYEDKASNIEKAIQTHTAFKREAMLDEALFKDLKEKKKAGTLNVAERKAYRDLEATLKGNDAYLTTLSSLVSTMVGETKQTPQELKDALATAQANEDPEQVNTALKQIFGSASGGTDIASVGSTLQALKQNKNLNPETAQFIDDALAFTESAKKLEEYQNKSTEAVHNDILQGGTEFRGVGSYNQAIASALAKDKDAAAEAELGKLTSWAQAHQLKATILRKAHNAAVTGEALSPEDQATLDMLNEERATKGLSEKNRKPFQPRPGVPGWENLLSSMEHEADLLTKAVPLATGLFAQYGKTPSVKAAKAPVTKPAPSAAPSTAKAPVVAEKAAVLTTDTINDIHSSKDYSDLKPAELRSVAARKRKRAAKFDPDKKAIIEREAAELEAMATKAEATPTPEPKEATDAGPVRGKEEDIRSDVSGSVDGTPVPAESVQAELPVTSTDSEPKQKINVYWGSGENKELSNLAPRKFTFEGEIYNSVEHAYQSNKSGEFDHDAYTRGKTQAKAPGKLGTDKSFNMRLMKELILESFKQNPDAKAKLIATGDAQITHNQDKGIWKEAFPKLLMEVRAELGSPDSDSQTGKSEPQKDLPVTDEPQAKPDIEDAFNDAGAQMDEGFEDYGDIETQSKEEMGTQEVRPQLLNAELTAPDTLPEDTENYSLRVNYVRKFFSPKKDITSPLQTTVNFFGSIGQYIVAKSLKVNEAQLLNSMAAFHAGFSSVVKDTFRKMTPEFRYKDPLQYLADDQGVLPDGVIDVITAASYKWLATRGQETLFNDTRAIQKILGFQKEVNIEAARPLLKEVGMHQDVLADTLGQEIYRLLEIKPNKDMHKNFESRLIKALGLHAIAALQHKGLLTMTPIYTGKSSTKHASDGTYGIDALKTNITNAMTTEGFALDPKDASFFVPEQRKPDLLGKTMANYYRVVTAAERDKQDFLQPSEELGKYAELWNGARQLYDATFATEPNQEDYSWAPAEEGQAAKLKRTTQYTTVEQADNVIRNNNEGYTLSGDTATPFFALDQQSQLEVAGFTDPKDEHIDDQDGVTDANNGLVRQLQAVGNWVTDALTQPKQLESVFYIPVEFYRNMRMGQRGSINPQNSKIHRYLFGMPAWKSDVTISRNKKGTLTVTEARFFEAIGLGLGVESGKKGGLKKALAEVNALLGPEQKGMSEELIKKRETLAAAVQVLRDTEQERQQPGFKFTPEQAKALVAGVKEGGENVKTFKALVEYSRYLNAKETGSKKFTTDIATEIDGMSNGPILMKMQFLFEVTKSNLAMLRNGGLSYDAAQPDVGVHLDNKAQMDAYEAGGMAWSESLELRMSDLLQELKATSKTDPSRAREVKQELSRITAAKRLLGEFNDKDGFVVKTVRKLIKYRIVATEYGSGADAVKAAFSSSVEEVIRGKLKKASQAKVDTPEERKQLHLALQHLAYDINILANLDPKNTKPTDYFQVPAKAEELFDKQGKLKKEFILKMRVPKASLQSIHSHLETNHGAALINGMNELFGETSGARKNFNLGFTIVTTLYNEARAIAVAARKKELDLPVVLREAVKVKLSPGTIVGFTLNDIVAHAGKLSVALPKVVTDRAKAQPDTLLRMLPDAVQKSLIKSLNGKTVSKEVVTYADLSIEEYKAIDAKLAKLFPTVTTPFGGKLDMAKQSKDKVYSPDGGRIEQQYGPTGNKGEFPSQKTGYLADPAILNMPGVSPMVMSIIMMDAYISNKTQGDGLSILNCHDGFYTGLDNVVEVNQALNRNMLELMRDFDLAQAMYESVDASIRAFNLFRTEHGGFNPADNQKMAWDQSLVEAFEKNLITANTYGKEQFDGDPELAIKETLAAMKNGAARASKNKAELLSYLKNLNQYYYPNAGIEITDQAPSDQARMAPEDLAELDATSEAEVKARAARLVARQEANKQELKALFAEYLSDTANTKAKPTWGKQKKDALPVAETSRHIGPAATATKSGPTDISIDEADYDPAVEISGQNVVDTYDQVKNTGTVQDTAGHDLHLKRILFDIIGKVMNPADLFLKTSAIEASAGAFVTQAGTKNKIFLTAQAVGPAPVSGILAQGIRMSTGEVFTHELVHAIVHHGLKMNARLRGQVATLYKLAQKELDKTGEGFKAFLPEGMDIADPANAFEVQAAKDRWDYIFGDKVQVVKVDRNDSATGLDRTKEYSQHLDEFMAFGLTNASFIQALNKLPMQSYRGKLFEASSWAGIKGKNIQETMVNIMNRITDLVMHNFTDKQPAANVVKELESLAKRLAEIDSNHKTLAAGMLQKVDAGVAKLSAFMNGQIKGVFSKLDQKLEVSHKIGAVKHHYMNQNSAFGQILRNYRSKVDGFNYGFTQAMGTSIKGLTDRVEGLHQLLNTRRIVIDQAREQATLKVKNALNNLWSRELKQEEKESVLRAAVRTDLNALRERFGMAGIQALVDTTPAVKGQLTALDAAITEIQQQLSEPHLTRFSTFFLRQAQSLGHIMVTGRALEKVSLLNPTLIAGMYNSKFSGMLTQEQQAEVTPLIDQLASLYALKFTPEQHRKAVHALMTEDMDAVESVLLAHGTLMQDAATHLFNDNPLKIMKGYTKDITNPQIKITSAPASEEAALKALGYEKADTPLPRDERDPDGTPMFLYTSRLGSANDQASGIASWSRNHAKGTNPIQNAIKQGKDPLTGVMNNATLLRNKTADLNAMFSGKFTPYVQSQSLPNYMIPQVDDKGKITKYRYTLSDSAKDGLLQRHNAYDDVMGAMAGTIPDKQGTTTINAELIQALKDVYDKEYNLRHAAYVEISPFTANEAHRNIYHMLPEKAKADLKRVWGGQKMWVSKDVVDLAFGSRKYSMLEAFAKDPAARNFIEKAIVQFSQQFFRDKSLTRVKQIEELLQGMTKIAKNTIIVKSFTTSFNNHISNLLYCKAMGVGYGDILRWKQEATVGALRYQASKKALDEAELHLAMNQKRRSSATVSQATIDQTGKRLEIKIRELKNELALNPVNDLMDAGLMQSIVDDVETGGVQSPYPDMIEKWTNTLQSKLPEKMVNVGKVVFLAEDTQGYKILSNAVKMTDFIGRYIMYKHYMKEAGSSVQAQRDAHAKNVARVIHEFVNFNLPDHRMIDYANSIGMFWFTKYTLRILRPVGRMIKDRPFEAIVSFALAGTLGMPNVVASTLFLGKSPLDILGNPLSAFISSSDDAITLQAAETLVDAMSN